MADFSRLPARLPPQPDEVALGGLACRIETGAVPCLAVDLEPGQSVTAPMAALLWREPSVSIGRGEGAAIVLRGPGRAGFARPAGGTIFPMPLAPDAVVQVAADHVLLAFGAGIAAEQTKGLGDRLTGGEGLRLDRVTAGPQGGVAWVQGAGCVFERGLIEGEMIDLRGSGLLCKDPGVRIENVLPLQGAQADLDLVLLRCTGPGRVALQTGAPAPAGVAVAAAPPVAKRGLLGRR
jgi:uncharacterized protein (AIM24 family)